MPELVENYNNRVKKFVYEMVESPVKIQEFVPPHMNTTSRQQYNIEKSKELLLTGKLPRNFSFHTFQTDKERINKYVQNKEKSFYKSENENENTKKTESPTYLQPSMRFKPRTELERIYETVNKYSFGRVDKELVNEQLRNLDVANSKYNSKKDNNLTFSHIGNRFKISSNILQILKEERDAIIKTNKHHEVTKNMNSIIEKNEKLMPKRMSLSDDNDFKITKKDFRQLVDKTIAQSLMKDLHVKTHFKGATNFSLNLKQIDEQKKILKKINNLELDMSGDSYVSYDDNIKTGKRNKFKADDLNPVIYNLDFNPMKSNKYDETKNVNKETLEYLELISKPPVLLKPEQFNRKTVVGVIDSLKNRRTGMNSLLKANPVEFFKQYKEGLAGQDESKKEEEKVTIGKEVYFKSQLDSISRSVLRHCNFTREKNENNNSYLKVGTGKLAITNGMTINDFKHKYKLQDI